MVHVVNPLFLTHTLLANILQLDIKQK